MEKFIGPEIAIKLGLSNNSVNSNLTKLRKFKQKGFCFEKVHNEIKCETIKNGKKIKFTQMRWDIVYWWDSSEVK